MEGKVPLTSITIDLDAETGRALRVRGNDGAELKACDGIEPGHKCLGADSIMLVKTNPCQWIYVNGQWHYYCW